MQKFTILLDIPDDALSEITEKFSSVKEWVWACCEDAFSIGPMDGRTGAVCRVLTRTEG